MTKIENFEALVHMAMLEKNVSHMRPVIVKEILHYDILFALESQGLLDRLTFQGGTCLRLCYGGYRFSEDLDFVGGYDFSSQDMKPIKDCLESYIGGRYGFEVMVKEPKDVKQQADEKAIKVDKWQVQITTSPERKNLPKQKIKLEVANVPAYSREANALIQNYDFLPDGYGDLVVVSESLDEILADKLVAFVCSDRYIRHRDIWDLRWLKQKGAQVNAQYVRDKIHDYQEKAYDKKLKDKLRQVDGIIKGKAFLDEMSRFLPIDVQARTLKKAPFLDLLVKENMNLLHTVREFI